MQIFYLCKKWEFCTVHLSTMQKTANLHSCTVLHQRKSVPHQAECPEYPGDKIASAADKPHRAHRYPLRQSEISSIIKRYIKKTAPAGTVSSFFIFLPVRRGTIPAPGAGSGRRLRSRHRCLPEAGDKCSGRARGRHGHRRGSRCSGRRRSDPARRGR